VGGYRFLDHTADVGIQATGADLKEAFSNAAQGMFAWMADLEAVQERQQRQVTAEASDVEGLLAAFLNELNYIFETQRLLFKRVQVLELSPSGPAAESRWRLVACGYGEPVDPARHGLRASVKAATYHMLQVERQDGLCRVQVILDV
jgi:SHS2 domain-containing protein